MHHANSFISITFHNFHSGYVKKGITMPVLQIRGRRLRKANKLATGHSIGKRRIQDSNDTLRTGFCDTAYNCFPCFAY